MRGPWNQGPEWEFVENPEPAVDGGDGKPSVDLSKAQQKVVQQMAVRTQSDVSVDPMTGADLGSGEAIKKGKS